MFSTKKAVVSALLLVSALGASGCAVDASTPAEGALGTSSEALSTEALSTDVGTVLNGFNTRSGNFTTTSCVDAKTALIPGTETATLSFRKAESLDTVVSELGLDTDASVKLGIWSADGKASFARKALGTKRGVSYLYKVAYDLDSKVIQDNAPRLADVARGLVGNPARFMQVCGDKFVRAENHGARLYVNLRFEFDSEDTKTSFDAKIGAHSSWLDFSQSLHALQSQYKGKVTIAMDAFQEGGDTSGLTALISGEHAAKCGMDDLASCDALMKDAITYASGDFRTSSKQKPAVTSYETRPYFELPEAEVPAIDDLPGTVDDARGRIAALFHERIALKARSIEADSSAGVDRAAKAKADAMLEDDYTKIAAANDACYDALKYVPLASDPKVAACVTGASGLAAKVHPVADLEAALDAALPRAFASKSLQRTSGANVCLDDFWGKQDNGAAVGSFACNFGGTQKWSLDAAGHLRIDAGAQKCAVVRSDNMVVMGDCDGAIKTSWVFDASGHLKSDKGLCLVLPGMNGDFAGSSVTACSEDPNQKIQLI